MAIAASPRWRPSQPSTEAIVGVGALAVLALISGFLIGRFGAAGGLLPAAVMSLLLTRYWLEAAPIAALLSAFVTTRVPGLAQSAGISISDILVTLATGLVLTQLRFTRALLRVLLVVGLYELVLLAPVVSSNTRASYVEWLHRGELVGGAVLCGALIAQRGRSLLALRLVAGLAAFYSLAAIDAYARTREAAYVLTMQKNGLGTLLMMVLLLAVFLPELVPGSWRWAYIGLLAAGIFASQSRGAMLAAAGGVLVAGMLAHRRLLRSPLVVLLAVGVIWYVYVNVESTEPVGVGEQSYSSVGSREFYRKQALTVWHRSPITGAGLKLFNDRFSGLKSEPHNVVVLALAEGGLFSLVALMLLQFGTLEVLRRHRSTLAVAAVAVVAGRATHGLVDIYWLGGTGSFCWFVTGMALGAPSLPKPGKAAPALSPAVPTRPAAVRSIQLAPAPRLPVPTSGSRAVIAPQGPLELAAGGRAEPAAPARPIETVSTKGVVQVLVVAFGSPALLEEAVQGVSSFRVVVVDNSSDDRVEEIVRRHGGLYIDPGRNLGFAAGVNRGLLEMPPDCDVLLLNPDARLDAADVGRLQDRLHRAGGHLAAVAPVQRNLSGELQRTEWPVPSPSLAWCEALGLHRLPGFRTRTQRFLTGSILLLNADALNQVGRFDERFFLYSEETDWQRRAFDLGWSAELVGSVTGFHVGGATSRNEHVRELHFHASGERFIRKWYGDGGWRRYRAAIVVGALLRSIVLGGEGAARSRHRAMLYLRGPIRAAKRLPSGR